MTDEDFRRLLPPPRRRPGLLDVVVRWRVEIVAVALVTLAWHVFGGRTLAIIGLVCVVLLIAFRYVRRCTVGLVRAVIVPHRVRSAIVQAGVADRVGHLPWLVAARPRGDTVRVSVWLRAGTSLHDLTRAAPLIATACGAQEVVVEHYSARQDRAALIVIRPRWGCWTR